MGRIIILFMISTLLCNLVEGSKFPDWLVTKIQTPVTLNKTPYGTILLSNGLIAREFTISPGFTTVDFYSFEKQSSLLRALSPEGTIRLDGVKYNIGGVLSNIPRAYLNRTALAEDMQNDPAAFQFSNYQSSSPVAPFPYTPRRGAPKDIIWPPKGLRLDVNFKAPSTAPGAHQAVGITVHYEMYVGIPLVSKWLTIEANSINQAVNVTVESSEELHVNWQWSDQGYKWLYVETDEPHGTTITWGLDPAAGAMPGSFEPFVNSSYQLPAAVPLGPSGFESFRTHELVVGSNDQERLGLARHRMMRLLAPHTQENPIFFHMTDSSSTAVKAIIDQMVEVGFEMMIYSFGSGFNLESTDPKYMDQIAADIAYANSKGIEVGGYDLIALSRHVQPSWMAVNAANQSIGSACFASKWYDQLTKQMLTFMNKTGLSMVETDGPYGGYACSSKTHAHHEDESDSIYWQNKLQGDFYKLLRSKNIYVNQPDNYFYQGGSRTGKSMQYTYNKNSKQNKSDYKLRLYIDFP